MPKWSIEECDREFNELFKENNMHDDSLNDVQKKIVNEKQLTPERIQSLAYMLEEIWNAAIEAAALIIQPIPHIDEERRSIVSAYDKEAEEMKKVFYAAEDNKGQVQIVTELGKNTLKIAVSDNVLNWNDVELNEAKVKELLKFLENNKVGQWK